MNEEPSAMRELVSSSMVRIALTGALAILALFLLAETIATVSGLTDPTSLPANVITVQGQGQATAVPDVAKIDFSVDQTAPAVSDAQAAATKQTNDALAAVKADGIADADVRTLSYNVSPQYTYPTCNPGLLCPNNGSGVITGYDVSETIEVTVHDLTKTGTILQSLGNLGVQNISGPQFTVDDDSTVTSAARADAITKANADAERLASQLGVHLGRIVNFSEDNGGTTPYPIYASAMSTGAKDAAPSVPTGQNQYTANVSITYEIH